MSGGIFNNHFIANCPQNASVKKNLKLNLKLIKNLKFKIKFKILNLI